MNQRLSKFEKHERKLGTCFLMSFTNEINHAVFTNPNSHSFYDGWYTTFKNPDVSTCFEIKVRNFEYTKYPDYILEAGKLRNLLKLHEEGKTILYMNFFKNDKGFYDCIVFNLSKRVPKWIKDGRIPTINKLMNAETFKSRYNKVEKQVVMLQYDPSIDTLITNTQWA